MAMNTVNVLEDFSTGKLNQHQKGTNGAAHVSPIPGKGVAPHNRELIQVNKAVAEAVDSGTSTDLHTVTWTTAEDVTRVTVLVAYGATATPDNTDGCYICFDATSDVLAALWLSPGTALADATVDTHRYFIPVGVPRAFYFTRAISRADVIASFNGTADDYDVILEAS